MIVADIKKVWLITVTTLLLLLIAIVITSVYLFSNATNIFAATEQKNKDEYSESSNDRQTTFLDGYNITEEEQAITWKLAVTHGQRIIEDSHNDSSLEFTVTGWENESGNYNSGK